MHLVRPLTPGTKLPNGATVIDSRFSGPSSGSGVVLAIQNCADVPYVTWHLGFDATRDQPYTVHGHYHRTLTEAVQDYQTR